MKFWKCCAPSCCLLTSIILLTIITVLSINVFSFALILGYEDYAGGMIFAFVVGPFAVAFFALPVLGFMFLVIFKRPVRKHVGITFWISGGAFLLLTCGAFLILAIWAPVTNLRHPRLEWWPWIDPAEVDDVKGSDDLESVFFWEEGKVIPGVFGEEKWFYCGEDSCTEGTFCAFPIVPSDVDLQQNNEFLDYRVHSFLMCSIDDFQRDCIRLINDGYSRCFRTIRNLWEGERELSGLVSVKSNVMRGSAYVLDRERAMKDVRGFSTDAYINTGTSWNVNPTPEGPIIRTSSLYDLEIYTEDQFEDIRDKSEGEFLGGILTLYILLAILLIILPIVVCAVHYKKIKRASFSLPEFSLPRRSHYHSNSSSSNYSASSFTMTEMEPVSSKSPKVNEMWEVWKKGKSYPKSYLSLLPESVIEDVGKFVDANN